MEVLSTEWVKAWDWILLLKDDVYWQKPLKIPTFKMRPGKEMHTNK